MRVLLIEDDSATAQSIELMLKCESFNAYTFPWIVSMFPDAVCVDVLDAALDARQSETPEWLRHQEKAFIKASREY